MTSESRNASEWRQLLTIDGETLPNEKATPRDICYCYRLLLGREPEDEGWQYWSTRVAEGLTVTQLVSAFLTSVEFRRRINLREAVRIDLGSRGVIFVDPADSGVAPAIRDTNAYEPHVTSALMRELKPDAVYVDVGCNIGWFVLLASARLPRGKVIAIEPNYKNVQLLYQTIAANPLRNVEVYPYAATDTRTLLQMSYDDAFGFVHSSDSSSDPFVQGISLDELLRDEPRIDVVKIDIEGHEPVALRGMKRILSAHRPIVFSEFHPKLIREHAGQDASNYFDDLQSLGYDIDVLTLEGEEIRMKTADDVMAHWAAVNRGSEIDGSVHLDLIARPAA